MGSRRIIRLASALIAPLLAAGAIVTYAGAASAATNWQGHHSVLYVSKSGKPGNGDRSCRSAAFGTIQSAVNAAPAGGTVIVCAGTYHEQVVISRPLSLAGNRATIDESGVTPSFTVMVGGQNLTIYAAVVITSSRVTFSGFTVTGAEGEGVLAAGLGGPVRGITITRDRVVGNDLGFGNPTPKSPYFECAAADEIPGDCGEGVHFAGNVAYSTIRGNFIARNTGGVLLSDDIGPTDHNVVEDNVITGNAYDCGITVPGHNPGALNGNGVPQPSVAGVYRNVIRDNVVTDNGVKGEGAGVLFANAGPGTASYDNLVEGNFIQGNGLSGVTMHAHFIGPGHEDLNGNVIIGNAIGKNNLDGDAPDGPGGPSDMAKTGVLVYSGGVQVTVTIARNVIFNNTIGIWLSSPVKASGLRTNKFIRVKVPVSAGH